MAKRISKPAAQNGKPAKGECPITRADFLDSGDITIDIGGNKITASPREFSSGSFGYYATGKAVVDIDGTPVRLQVTANIVAIGSKDA